MDTLSSSVSTLKVPTFHATTISRELTRLKTNNTASYSSSSLLRTKPNTSSLISNKAPTKHRTQTLLSPSLSPSSPSSLSPAPSTLHRSSATGYAVALLDKAQHDSTVHLVGKDVGRLLKLLRNGEIRSLLSGGTLGEREKGRVVSELAEKGGFQRHLVRVVKMLVAKNKSGLVKEVLEEFERIYDDMCGTSVVLVLSAKRMKKDDMFGIAKRVQRVSRALRVKVRNLVTHEIDSLSYAHL